MSYTDAPKNIPSSRAPSFSSALPREEPATSSPGGRGKQLKSDAWRYATVAAVPHIANLAFRTFLGVTVALYVLNQKHALPRPLSAVVSKTLFWPTLPITMSRRIGKWMTQIDDTVVMGGAPFAFLNYPHRLYNDFGVRGVINLCEEYQGPLRKYKEMGMEQLHLPTTDHFEPTVEDLISAISFIRRHEAHGNSVYVHCRAGHGRSAAVVFAWLMYKDPTVDLEELNAKLRKQRDVRKTLWKQPNTRKLHSRLLKKGTVLLDLVEESEQNDDSERQENSDGDDL